MMENNRQIYLNPIQMKVQAIQAKWTYAILSRGTGKTSGIGAGWFFHRVQLFPKVGSFIQGKTYSHILTNTIPPFIAQLEKMGLKRGIHFVVRKAPPKTWKSKPTVAPEVWDNTIAWANGHVTYFLSQDRPGSPNSLSLCFGMVDEAKFLKIDQFNSEVPQAMRGSRELFEHLPEYRSLLFMTDQPTHPEGQWILEMEKQMKPEQINLILNLAFKISKARAKLAKSKAPSTRKKIERSINNLTAMWVEARLGKKLKDGTREGSTYFIEGNVFDNIHALGVDYVKDQQRLLPKAIFDVSILNKRMVKIKDGFYALLDDERHCYAPRFNYKYIDTIHPEDGDVPDCRQDSDIDPKQPLHLGFDHGARINCLAIGQGTSKRIDVRSFMYVLNPQTTKDLVTQFCIYYAPHQKNNKTIHYYYDHTSKAESGKAQNITYVSEVVDTLKSHGWKVVLHYIGRTSTHTDRFKFWANCLRGDVNYPTVSFNLYRTETLRIAMHTTAAKSGNKQNEIKKDKSKERDPKFPQERAPHPTDAVDTLVQGMSGKVKGISNSPALPAGYS